MLMQYKVRERVRRTLIISLLSVNHLRRSLESSSTWSSLLSFFLACWQMLACFVWPSPALWSCWSCLRWVVVAVLFLANSKCLFTVLCHMLACDVWMSSQCYNSLLVFYAGNAAVSPPYLELIPTWPTKSLNIITWHLIVLLATELKSLAVFKPVSVLCYILASVYHFQISSPSHLVKFGLWWRSPRFVDSAIQILVEWLFDLLLTLQVRLISWQSEVIYLFAVQSLRILQIQPFGRHIDRCFKVFVDDRDGDIVILTHLYLLVGCGCPLWLHSGISDALTASRCLSVFCYSASCTIKGAVFVRQVFLAACAHERLSLI